MERAKCIKDIEECFKKKEELKKEYENWKLEMFGCTPQLNDGEIN